MQVQVVIQSSEGGERAETFSAQKVISIGRHPNSVLRLDSDLVSRQHALVQAKQKSLLVEDVSTNGTLAGELLLRREVIEVPYGTPITVGDFTLYFYPVDARGSAIGPPAQAMGSNAPMVSGSGPAVQQHHSGLHMPPAPYDQGPQGGTTKSPVMTREEAARLLQSVPARGPSNGPPNAAPPGPMPAVQAQKMPTRPTDKQRERDVEIRREIHKQLLQHLDLATLDARKLDDPSTRPKVLSALRRIIETMAATGKIPPETNRDVLTGELVDEALGLGPLERFLADPLVSEIMVIDPNTIYVEQAGKLRLSEARFTDDERVRAVIERIVTPLGRRIDEQSPLVDARLKDGSRVNAIIKPLALKGACITIRKFSKVPLTLEKLVGFGALTEQMGRFLVRSVIAKRNIVISGGTGSGKTTLLNVLSAAIPPEERVVTIEDAAELQLKQPHVVSLETKPANLEGKGEYSIRDLVKNALRMRPDRIVVGECRGGEALDMLQAMNTGHDGSLTTTHANSPPEAISRLETLCLMSGIDLPVRAIRDQIAGSVHLIAQQSRMADGSRKVTWISEVVGIDGESGEVELRPIFQFVRTGTGPKGEVLGDFRATGYLPSYLQDFIVMGLVKKGEPYL